MSATDAYLDTVEGEIAFFRSVMRARPVGIHRHFHMLAIRNAIYRDTGHCVAAEDLWDKLRKCYNLDLLENIEPDGFETPDSKSGQLGPLRSPRPNDNLNMHPYFRSEFLLPIDETMDAIISRRRMRASLSVPSSPAAPSPVHQEKHHGRRRTRSKYNNMAGLVAGDSDSSALTQESGEEDVAPTPATATDGATEYGDDGEGDGREQSPEPSLASRNKKPTKQGRRNSTVGRPKGSGSSRAVKKRKR